MNTSSSIQIRTNLKSLPRKKREEFRNRLFALFEQGTKAYTAAKLLHLNPACVHKLFTRFKTEGRAAIFEQKRGPTSSVRQILSNEEKGELAHAITKSSPHQLLFDFALWSSKAVVSFVNKKFHKKMCLRTARRYLQKMGFTYQCPIRQAREQNPQAVQIWLEQTYPSIKEDAKKRNARIFWADESSIMTSTTIARGYSKRGVTPVLRIPEKRSLRCNYIAAVDNKGEMYFKTFDGAMNTNLFKDFIIGLCEEIDAPISLIVDNLKVHHANCLAEWFEEMGHTKGFRIHFLPSYSPEYNPGEYLNRTIKADIAEQAIQTTTEAVVKQTTENLLRRKEK